MLSADEHLCYTAGSAERVFGGSRMVDADRLIESLVEAMGAFETLTISDGRIVHERGFKAASLAEVREYLATRRDGERLVVSRFPDGWKLTFSRLLLL